VVSGEDETAGIEGPAPETQVSYLDGLRRTPRRVATQAERQRCTARIEPVNPANKGVVDSFWQQAPDNFHAVQVLPLPASLADGSGLGKSVLNTGIRSKNPVSRSYAGWLGVPRARPSLLPRQCHVLFRFDQRSALLFRHR
jgi:hypothetical protein